MIFVFTSCWYSSVKKKKKKRKKEKKKKKIFKDYLSLNVFALCFGLLQSAFQILIVHSSGLKKVLFSKG